MTLLRTSLCATLCFFCISLCVYKSTYCQYYENSGGLSAAKSNASITDINIWSLQNNPAAFAFCKQFHGGIEYKNNFGLTNIAHSIANFGLETAKGNVGISYIYYGNQYYTNTISSLIYSLKISETSSCAVKINYLLFVKEIAEYESNMAYPEVALYSKPFPEFSYGIHVIHPYNYIKKNKTIESMYKIGCSYDMYENFKLSGNLNKKISTSMIYNVGLEYKIKEKISMGIGYSNSLQPFSCGLSFTKNLITIEYATQIHNYLGLSHIVSFAILI